MKPTSNNDWLDIFLDEFLSEPGNWAYQPGGMTAAEPTALAALALAAHGRLEAAGRACDRLADLQGPDGSVAVTAHQPTPCWPTGWAVLAWTKVDSLTGAPTFRNETARAIDSILALHGRTMEAVSEMGHNPRLDGWPWVEGTHPWCEPTAINMLALKATGHGDAPRAQEAAAMLVDRLLPDGGCNYGNTTVLGQVLRPHIEPSGLVLVALAGEPVIDGRLERSLTFLEQAAATTRGGASLAYALLGLTAHARRPDQADAWLSAAARQSRAWQSMPQRKALLTLAAAVPCPLITTSQTARHALRDRIKVGGAL
ncbi:MAG TPA: hypothetical protein VHC22_31160 [Pirellulales bacterium]|nr:hypothetical protein [Pirellulales bacterium]